MLVGVGVQFDEFEVADVDNNKTKGAFVVDVDDVEDDETKREEFVNSIEETEFGSFERESLGLELT